MQASSITRKVGLALLATSLSTAAMADGPYGPNPRHVWEYNKGTRATTLGTPDSDDVVLTLKCLQIGEVETRVHRYAPLNDGRKDGDQAWVTFLIGDTETPVPGKLSGNKKSGKFDLAIQHDLGSAMMSVLKGNGIAEIDRDDRHTSRNGPQRISLKGARQAIDALISACSPGGSGAASTTTPASPVKRWDEVSKSVFKDDFALYPASEVYRGKVVLPAFSGRDKNWSEYRTRIRNGMKDGANFAGRLALIQWGCGAGCRYAAVGDVSTGRVYDFPLGGEGYMYLTLKHRPDSRLVVAYWQDGDRCMRQYLEWTGGAFREFGRADIGGEDACAPAMRE